MLTKAVIAACFSHRLVAGFRFARFGGLLALMAVCGVLLAAPCAIAADQAGAVDDVPTEQHDEQSKYSEYLRAAGEVHRQRLHLAMQLRQGEIDRAVALSDPQSKKIAIAAKGSIDRVIDRWMEQMLRNNDFEIQFGQMQAEQAKDSLIEMGSHIDVNQVTEEEIWKNGVNQQFTTAQRDLYKEMVEERKAFMRRISIGQLVVLLDDKLRFSDDQRQEMTRIFDEALDKDFSFDSIANGELVFGRVMGAKGAIDLADVEENKARGPFARVSDERLAKVLSENQMKSWLVLRRDPDSLISGAGNRRNWIRHGAGNVIINGGVVELDGRILLE